MESLNGRDNALPKAIIRKNFNIFSIGKLKLQVKFDYVQEVLKLGLKICL